MRVKGALGESVGASSLWQTICGAQSLRTQLVPPDLLVCTGKRSARLNGTKSNGQLRRAVVSVCGLNQQVAGLRLSELILDAVGLARTANCPRPSCFCLCNCLGLR